MMTLPMEMQILPQIVLDVAIKGAVVLLAAWAVAAALRNSSAALRHWVWCAALAGLLALPGLSLALPGWRVAIWPASSAVAAREGVMQAPLPVSAPAARQSLHPGMLLEEEAPPLSPSLLARAVATIDWRMTALVVWLVGAAIVLARFLIGTARVWRLARSARQVTGDGWTQAARKLAANLRLRRRVALLASNRVKLPMTCGVWRPVVLLPADAEGWSRECRHIVLLHELAHIKRRDCLTQSLAQVVCAIHWFNPLVWLAARRLRVEREVACDDYVLEVGTRASDYAAHLVEIASAAGAGRDFSPVAVGMACSQLESRVRAILDPRARRGGLNHWAAGLVNAAAVSLIVPLAMLQPSNRAEAVTRNTTIEAAATAPAESSNETEHRAAAIAPTPAPRETEPTNQTESTVIPQPEVDRDEDSEEDEQQGTGQGVGQGAGQGAELSADQLIQMKIHGITPEYIESVRKLGFDNLSIRQLVEMRVHNIDEAFVKEARGWGLDKPTIRELVQLKVAGVTSEYIAAMKKAGFDNLPIRELSSLRLHGAGPEYVETMRRLGYANLTARQLTSLKVHGVDEAFIKEVQALSAEKLSVNDLLQIRIAGVTPDYARSMKSLGIEAPVKKLSQMKIHGVTEAFIKEMRALGFDNLTVDQLMQLRIHGITADYVRKMRAAGLKNVSVNQMIEMKIHGVDSILLKTNR
jgi:beta-lactamase regulating signal transducer with metallopeptidase domain